MVKETEPADTNRVIYYVYCEQAGEVEGMFDADGNLLYMWSCNDACWRNEYFRGFMETLGIDVQDGGPEMERKLFEAAEERWGPFDEGFNEDY